MLGPETPLRRIEDDEEVKSRASQFLSKREASAPVVQGGTARSKAYERPIWYSFTSSFTTSIAKQPTLCPTLWPASLKTHSHRVKHMVKLPKHDTLPRS
jgi:hypothetical protein